MNERKREAFEKWVKSTGLCENFYKYPDDGKYRDEHLQFSWDAYQQAYDDMYPVFDRIEQIIENGGTLSQPNFGRYYWDIINHKCEQLATGETFRELCVNLIMSDGKDEK